MRVIDTKEAYSKTVSAGIDTESDEIYFFDRGDLFLTDAAKELIIKSKEAFILVDLKNANKLHVPGVCCHLVGIKYEKGKYRVQ